MPTYRFVPTAVAAVIVFLAGPALAQKAAEFIPDSVTIALTLPQPDEKLKDLRALLERNRLDASPVFEAMENNPGLMQAKIGLLGIVAAAETDPWSVVGAILGKEVTIGLRPIEDDKPEFIVVAITRDATTTDRLVRTLHTTLGVERNGEPDSDRSHLVGDVRIFQIGESFECRVDDAIILTSTRDLMQSALSAHANGAGRLADTPSFQASFHAAPPDSVAWAHIEPALLKAAANKNDSQLINNPLGGVLFGGWQQAIRSADSANAWLSAIENGLALNIEVSLVDALPATHRGFVPSDMQAPEWSSASLEGFLGEIAVTRDWADLFAERESFLTLPAASQFVNFTNTLTSLMGRIDFVDDVLGKTSGPARLIMARQDFESREYTPSPKLPAFALVAPLQLDAPDRFARQFYSAGLGTLAVISLDAAQKGNPSLLIDSHEYEGIRVVAGEYIEPEMDEDGMVLSPGGTAAAIQYNFEPAIALIGNEFVVTTSVDLMHRLIDIVSETSEAVDGFTFEDSALVDVNRLAMILRDNHDELIADRMLKNDQPKAAATNDIEAIIESLSYADRIRVVLSPGQRSFKARVELSLREPS